MKPGNIAKLNGRYVEIVVVGRKCLVEYSDKSVDAIDKHDINVAYDNPLDAIEKLHKLIKVKDMMIDSMLQACEKIVEHVKNDLDEKVGGTDDDE